MGWQHPQLYLSYRGMWASVLPDLLLCRLGIWWAFYLHVVLHVGTWIHLAHLCVKTNISYCPPIFTKSSRSIFQKCFFFTPAKMKTKSKKKSGASYWHHTQTLHRAPTSKQLLPGKFKVSKIVLPVPGAANTFHPTYQGQPEKIMLYVHIRSTWEPLWVVALTTDFQPANTAQAHDFTLRARFLSVSPAGAPVAWEMFCANFYTPWTLAFPLSVYSQHFPTHSCSLSTHSSTTGMLAWRWVTFSRISMTRCLRRLI